ncbi:hypothetical protein EFE36_12245 [Lactiplantibacillus pentosus]|nr:hypothetical protein [Lactiplantibacillus pentosus]
MPGKASFDSAIASKTGIWQYDCESNSHLASGLWIELKSGISIAGKNCNPASGFLIKLKSGISMASKTAIQHSDAKLN